MGYAALVASAVAAAIGIVCQTYAARRAERRGGVDPGLLARLATDRVYLLGFTAQVAAFVLAFLARGTLPLFLVQAGSSAAVGVAAVLAWFVLGWRVGRAEVVALVVLLGGLVLLVGAAHPSTAGTVGPVLGWTLLAGLAVTAAAAVPASRLHGGRGVVAMGVLAGIAFAILAIAARPVAGLGSVWAMALSPLAWLMVGSALVGQLMLAGALQRGSATAAAASMDATTCVVASAAGLAVLGDAVVDGRGWWVAAGLVLVTAAVAAMAVVGRPVDDARGHAAAPGPAPAPAPDPATDPTPGSALPDGARS
ncbi:hypothetical protein [Pseudonocardia phyllosphaerae]|uniref:hypothetical protein n=1 Tax=Pseudonocardia phyllosphaerae TaxID=3390502 RepID=UPI00397A41F3